MVRTHYKDQQGCQINWDHLLNCFQTQTLPPVSRCEYDNKIGSSPGLGWLGILILCCPAAAITQLLTNTVQTASVRIENEGLMDYRQSDISRAQVDIITTGDMDTTLGITSSIHRHYTTLGGQLFQKSWNFMLSTPTLYSLVLVMKGFVQDLPPYLSENLSAFGLKLPSKMAIIARFGWIRRQLQTKSA